MNRAVRNGADEGFFLVFDGHKTVCQLTSSTKRCWVSTILVCLWNGKQLPVCAGFVSHRFVLVCLVRKDREGGGSQLEGTSGGHLVPGQTWIRWLALCHQDSPSQLH